MSIKRNSVLQERTDSEPRRELRVYSSLFLRCGHVLLFIAFSVVLILSLPEYVMGEQHPGVLNETVPPLRYFIEPARSPQTIPLWLSVGIQDAMTIDLWSAGVNSLHLSDFLSARNLSIDAYLSLTHEEIVAIAEQKGIGVLISPVVEAMDEGTVYLDISARRLYEDAPMVQRKVQLSRDHFLSGLSAATLECLEGMSVSISSHEKALIALRKTDSFEAFRLNAQGYTALQRLVNRKLSQRTTILTQSAEAFQEAIERDPGYAEAWNNLGWTLSGQGYLSASMKSFQRALEIKPALLDAQMGMASIFKNKGKHALALEQIEQALQINGTLQWVRAEYLDVLRRLQDGRYRDRYAWFVENGTAGEVRTMIQILSGVHDERGWRLLTSLIDDERGGYDALEALYAAAGEASVEQLILHLDSFAKRWETLKMLMTVDTQRGAPFVMQYLADKRSELREAAARILGTYRIEAAVPLLVNTTSEYFELSREALLALSLINTPEAVAGIVTSLDDQRADTRRGAAIILGSLKSSSGSPALWHMARGDDILQNRAAALIALCHSGEEGAVAELLALYESSPMLEKRYISEWVRKRHGDFEGTVLDFLIHP